jgi:hypothetical protein
MLATLLILLGLSAPVRAQDQSLAAQLDDAVRAFLGGHAGVEDYQRYRETVLNGIDGRWLPILIGTYIAGTDVGKFCERMAFEVVGRPPYGWTMKRPADPKIPGSEVIYTYVSMGGNTFDEQVDPAQQLRWLGLDDEKVPENQRVFALNAINGIATVYRPSADILVIQTNYRPPKIFARCP